MNARTTIITVFILGLICGILLTLMWTERNTPPDNERKYRDWRGEARSPMATRKVS